MPSNNFNIQGFFQKRMFVSREKYGQNAVDYQNENTF